MSEIRKVKSLWQCGCLRWNRLDTVKCENCGKARKA